MSGVNTLRISSATAPSLADTQVVPVLSGAPTLDGFHPETGPSASLVTLADLGAYMGSFAGFSGFPALAPDGSSGAPSYSWDNYPTKGMWYDSGNSATMLSVPNDYYWITAQTLFQPAVGGVATLFVDPTNNEVDIGAAGTTVLLAGASLGAVFTTAASLSAPTIQIGDAAGDDAVVIGGAGYGAGVASVRFNGLTTAAVNNLVGTLTNAPVTGNPTFWMPVNIAGSVKYVPCW